MTKYHLTEDGPKKCSAKPGNCPITRNTDAEHYETLHEATQAYEQEMSNKTIPSISKNTPQSTSTTNLKIITAPVPSSSPEASSTLQNSAAEEKTYAPRKPELQPVSHEEIHEIIDKYKNTKGLTLPKILDAPVVGYSLVGSSLYNLHHEESDRDIFILTDSNDKKNHHKIFEDGTDIRVFTVKNFVSSILDRSPANVDILKAKMTQFDKNSPMYPYLNNVRFNKYRYIDGMESESRTQLREGLMRDDENDKRAHKSVKTSLRNYVLSDRIYTQEQDYHPEFSDTQREEFYKSLHFAIEETNDTRRSVKPFLDKEIEIGTRYKGNPQLLKEDVDYQAAHEEVKEHLNELADKLHHMAKKINEV